MAKDLGYTPAPAGPGKDNYNTTGGGSGTDYTNAHRKTKKAQDGQTEPDGPAARSHNWNEDGAVNGDPEKGKSKGKTL
jgi:hypothetical protein